MIVLYSNNCRGWCISPEKFLYISANPTAKHQGEKLNLRGRFTVIIVIVLIVIVLVILSITADEKTQKHNTKETENRSTPYGVRQQQNKSLSYEKKKRSHFGSTERKFHTKATSQSKQCPTSTGQKSHFFSKECADSSR